MNAVPKWVKSMAKIGGYLFGLLLLIVLLRPMPICGNSPPSKIKTQATLKDLTLGIKGFQAEYGIYPLGKPQTQEDLKQESSGDLLRILMGQTVGEFNPRKIAYIEPPPAKNGKQGLTDDNRVVDAWGNPYIIIMDTNYDSRLTNPDVKNTDPEIRKDAPEVLPLRVLAYSRGEDGIEGTKDDLASWR